MNDDKQVQTKEEEMMELLEDPLLDAEFSTDTEQYQNWQAPESTPNIPSLPEKALDDFEGVAQERRGENRTKLSLGDAEAVLQTVTPVQFKEGRSYERNKGGYVEGKKETLDKNGADSVHKWMKEKGKGYRLDLLFDAVQAIAREEKASVDERRQSNINLDPVVAQMYIHSRSFLRGELRDKQMIR